MKPYRQCRLERKQANVTDCLVTHIPEKYAKLGELVKLQCGGDWSEGWLVVYVGGIVPEPESPHITFRKHKRRTGDSLPKEKA